MNVGTLNDSGIAKGTGTDGAGPQECDLTAQTVEMENNTPLKTQHFKSSYSFDECYAISFTGLALDFFFLADIQMKE